MLQARSPSFALQRRVEARKGVSMSVMVWLTPSIQRSSCWTLLAADGQAQTDRDGYRKLQDGKVLSQQQILVRDGKILDPEPVFYCEKRMPTTVVDCDNALIVPGFIDVQINGGYGYDFSSDPSQVSEAVRVVSKGLLASGVTSFCPTLVTSPPEIYKQSPSLQSRIDVCYSSQAVNNCSLYRCCLSSTRGQAALQVLLCWGHTSRALSSTLRRKELIPLNTCSHLLRYVWQGPSVLEEVYGTLDNIAMITLAPELPGVVDAVSTLTRRGVVVSVGHSSANLEEGEAAVAAGASFITHLFNAMLPVS
ncbi:Metal-dependent hydrolase [Trinorchestia longiramus]|nr:Metal-dependent hydrolase [Trinorchestia longiramus]